MGCTSQMGLFRRIRTVINFQRLLRRLWMDVLYGYRAWQFIIYDSILKRTKLVEICACLQCSRFGVHVPGTGMPSTGAAFRRGILFCRILKEILWIRCSRRISRSPRGRFLWSPFIERPKIDLFNEYDCDPKNRTEPRTNS